MRRLSILAAVLVVSLVSSLAYGTGYHKKSIVGGYTDTKLQEGIYRVSFQSNAFTKEDKTADYAMLRSAEVALENGYPYFVIMEGGTNSNTQYMPPTTAQTYGSTTYMYGGGSVNKPIATYVIKCLNEKPKKADAMIWDAQEVKTNIMTKYGLKEKTEPAEGSTKSKKKWR